MVRSTKFPRALEIWNYIYKEHYISNWDEGDEGRLIEAESGLWHGLHRIAICYYYGDDSFYSTPAAAEAAAASTIDTSQPSPPPLVAH